MLNITSLEQTLIALIEGSEFDKETLENIETNCYSEIISFGSEDVENRREYIELVCRVYGLALIELGK